MEIKTTAPKFVTADGREFDTRKEAEAHQATAVRVIKLNELFHLSDFEGVDAATIAENAEAVIAALTNPLGKGRKAKAAEAPAS